MYWNIIINIITIHITNDKKRQQIYVLAEAKCERSILCLLHCTPTQMPTNTNAIFFIISIIIIVIMIIMNITISITIIIMMHHRIETNKKVVMSS